MAQFSYKARKRSGEMVEGAIEVADRGAALAHIEKLGLFPVALDAGGAAAAAAAPRGFASRKFSLNDFLPARLRERRNRPKKPKMEDMARYAQQMANLIKAGMPLTMALNTLSSIQSKGISAEVSKALKQDVMEGKSLSDSMAKQPVIFGDLFVNMVRAGEQSGSLVEVLRRLGDHYSRFAEVQQKFKSALIYPALVAVIGVGIVIFFMTFMLPRFLTIFTGLNIQLPLSTRILMNVSYFFAHYWWLIPLLIVTVTVIFNRFRATESGKRKIDKWKIDAPVFGRVNRLNLYGQFARTLSTLLQNGVPVLTALKITEAIMPNRIFKEALAKTREEVTDGKTIAQPLARSKIFPQMMVDLIKIGEETGDVPGSLSNLADNYENELSIALRVMTNLIEPVIIVVMAMGVGFLLLSVFSALFKLTSNISR
jgi:type II secretory pathway component PulF